MTTILETKKTGTGIATISLEMNENGVVEFVVSVGGQRLQQQKNSEGILVGGGIGIYKTNYGQKQSLAWAEFNCIATTEE